MTNDHTPAPGHEKYEDWAGAYVLSALEPAERSEFEVHLARCEVCRFEVQQFAPLPGMFRHLDIEELETDGVDELAVARTTSEAINRADGSLRHLARSEQKWKQRALGAAAAAVLFAGLATGSLLTGGNEPPSTETVDAIELAFESTAEGVVEIEPREWGTRIELDLIGLPSRPEYQLWTVDDAGDWQRVVSWPSPPEGIAKVAGGTVLSTDMIDQLVITAVDDRDDIVLEVPV